MTSKVVLSRSQRESASLKNRRILTLWVESKTNKIMMSKKLMTMVRVSLIRLPSQVLHRLVDAVDAKCVIMRSRRTQIPLENSPQVVSVFRIMVEDEEGVAEVVAVEAEVAKMVKRTITTKTTTVAEVVETEEAIIAEAEEATMIIEVAVEDITTAKEVVVDTKIERAVEVVGMTAEVVAAIMIAAAEVATSKATIIVEVVVAEAAVFLHVRLVTLLLMRNVTSRQSRKEINSVTSSRMRCEDW